MAPASRGAHVSLCLSALEPDYNTSYSFFIAGKWAGHGFGEEATSRKRQQVFCT